MAKRIMCYLKDEDLEKLGDVSGADLVGYALLGIDNSIKSDLAFIKELLVGMKTKESFVNPLVDSTIANTETNTNIKSSGFNDVPHGFNNTRVKRSLSDKQKEMAEGIINTLLDGVTNEGFKNGDGRTHRFESMYTWLQGDVRDFVKEVVKHKIEGMQHIDFTQFKF